MENVKTGETPGQEENVNNEVTEGQPNEQPEDTDLNVTNESNVIIEEVPVEYDPDEKILADLFAQGKDMVTTNDLMALGFDTERMSPFSFQVGHYKLSRLVMISPFKIEKID